VYDEKVLVGLDFAINEASKRGIRVVLVFANYWAMYGGIDQYNIWSFEAGSGAPLPPLFPCPGSQPVGRLEAA
jgi:mannan endo-1,4-beta-mannosidase